MSASDKKKLRKEQHAATLTEKQQKELKEAKKLKTYTLTFAVVMILVVAIVVGVSVRSPINSAINQNTHAITVGEHKLSTADFNYYYVDAINDYCDSVYDEYYSTFGNYWAMMLGFNTDEPLNKQYQDEEKKVTWAQVFVDMGIENAKKLYSLFDEAVKNGHKLTEKEQKNLDSAMTNLEAMATYYGYSNASQYLRATYGDGATIENYATYCGVNAMASSYATAYSKALEYTKEEIDEYQKDKYDNYSRFDYSYYLINVSNYLGEGVKDDTGKVTYTDQQKADALAAAKKDVDILVNSKVSTPVQFDSAIKTLEINKDNDKASCTQYTEVFFEDLGYAEIQEWLTAEDRKIGDYGYIPIMSDEEDEEDKEILGYLVILYQDRDDCNTKLVTVRHILRQFSGYYYDDEGKEHLDDSSKVKAKTEAQSWYDEWLAGDATVESFAELANKYSDDGDGTTGGLYEDIYPGKTVEGFDDWCFDKDRKPGDTGIVESEYGYHVMYFVETQEQTFREYMVEIDMNNEDSTKWMEGLAEAIKVEQINLNGLEWDKVLG